MRQGGRHEHNWHKTQDWLRRVAMNNIQQWYINGQKKTEKHRHVVAHVRYGHGSPTQESIKNRPRDAHAGGLAAAPTAYP